MNKIKLLAALTLSLITQCALSQNKSQIDTLFLKKIAKQVKNDILNSYRNDSITIEGDCYYGKIGGEKASLSCFEITWNLKWIGDINRDGEDDIILRVEDDGLGGGGNAYGYDYYVIYLKDKKIINIDTIFGGGKFSHAFLEVDSVSNHTIFATLTENQILDVDVDSKTQPKEIKLQFIRNNNKVVEKSYFTCPFQTMDKRIFKPEVAGVKRGLRSNDLFEEEQNERLNLNNKDIFATFSGCKTLELFFAVDRPFDSKLKDDPMYKENELLKESTFLEDNTRFGDLFALMNLDIKKKGLFLQKTVPMSNGWSYYTVISSYSEENKEVTRICIRFINKNTDKIIPDFWEEIKR
jgi:hypothetical protein